MEYAEQNSPGDFSRSLKRKRVALACDNCRERKIRCDGSKPICGPCGKRGEKSSLCSYTVLPSSTKHVSEQEYIDSLKSQIRELQEVVKGFRFQPEPSSCHQDQPDNVANCVLIENNERSIQELDNDASELPRLRSGRSTRSSGAPGEAPNHVSQVSTASPTGHGASQRPSPRGNLDDLSRISNHSRRCSIQDSYNKSDGPSPISAMGAAIAVQANLPNPGNNEFYGQSSVWSLLQDMPHSGGRCGANAESQPSTRQSRQHPREGATVRQSGQADMMLQPQYALPPRAAADKLLNSYFSNVHIFYPWTHSIAFRHQYSSLWSEYGYQVSDSDDGHDIGLGSGKCPPPVFFCSLNAMFALGCEFSDLPPQQKDTMSAMFHDRMKSLLTIELLDNGSISLVQTLLMAGMYLSCTQYPTRCYNLVGLAGRMAVGLGLQTTKHEQEYSGVENEIRRRVWHGCVQMEMTVSMTLGRPPSMYVVNDIPLPNPVDDEYLLLDNDSTSQPQEIQSINLFNAENIKLAKILAQILTQIYNTVPGPPAAGKTPNINGEHPSFDVLMHIDSMLEGFKSCLPDVLKWDGPKDMSLDTHLVFKRQSNVLQARYFHLKVLIYRPSFSSFCASIRADSQRSRGSDLIDTSPEKELKMALCIPCAVRCVRATCDLVRSIEVATKQDATGAWWFSVFYLVTAGIILISAESAQKNTHHFDEQPLQERWDSCIRTLQHLSTRCSRAHDYLESLTLLRKRARCTNNNTQEHQGSSITRQQHSRREVASEFAQSSDHVSRPDSRNLGVHVESNMDMTEPDNGMMGEFGYDLGITPLLENWGADIENLMVPSGLFGDSNLGYPASGFL